ncbi:unnamed protein product [Effrenium voratum]|nr:unnamed protein product [Effrenium voratum]
MAGFVGPVGSWAPLAAPAAPRFAVGASSAGDRRGTWLAPAAAATAGLLAYQAGDEVFGSRLFTSRGLAGLKMPTFFCNLARHVESLEIIGQEMVPYAGGQGEEELEEPPRRWPNGPEGEPEAVKPLFTPEQLREFNKWDEKAPLLRGPRMDQPRPAHLPVESNLEGDTPGGGQLRPRYLPMENPEPEGQMMKMMAASQDTRMTPSAPGVDSVYLMQMMQELMTRNQRLQHEVEMLKKQLKETDADYGTPESREKVNGMSTVRDNQNHEPYGPTRDHSNGKGGEGGLGAGGEKGNARDEQASERASDVAGSGKDGHHMDVMLKLMEGMQMMQKQLLEQKEKTETIETVKVETEKEQATGRRDLVCRFYMKDTGCRKGRSCEWQHPTDETARGRCWECGSVEHMRKDCPRKQKPTSPEKPAAVRRVAQENDVATTPASASSPKKEEIKPTREKETVVEDLKKDESMGGGVAGSSKDATEPQRLAGSQKGGEMKVMRITEGGIIVQENEGVGSIIPLGLLVERLHCVVTWDGDECRVVHPELGALRIHMEDGCPYVTQRRRVVKTDPNRRIKHKHAYCLSLDLAGPLKKGRDIDGRSCKYMLVGAYTWPKNPLKSEEIPEKERDGGGEAGKAKGLEEVKKPDQPGQRPEDYWTTSANGKYVIRVHKSHRKVRFFPDDAPGCPVPVERLRGRRRTVARTTKDGPLKMFMDDWRNAEKTEKVFEDESRWAGRTIFQLEGPEEEEPQEEEKEEGDPDDPADPEPPEGIWDFELEELVGEQEDGEMEEGDLDKYEEDEEKREEPLEIEVHTLAEFMNHALRRWRFNRDIAKTSTAADDWRSNGRAEVAIQHLKSRMRRVLFAAEVDGQWWPAAARYVVEKEKRTRQRKEGTIPRFCQEVMVKKRKWKSEELGQRHVKGKYLAPVVDVPNGHAVMREDGTVQVAAYVLHHWKPLPEPVDGWQFVERRGDEGEEREPEEIKTEMDYSRTLIGTTKRRSRCAQEMLDRGGRVIFVWWRLEHQSQKKEEPWRYLPDIDFASIPAAQAPYLASKFQLWTCSLPETDSSTCFVDLVRGLEAWLSEGPGDKKVVLLGEGFGGLLALALALKGQERLRGVVLVNPSTGLSQQPWARFGLGANGPNLPVGPFSELLRLGPDERPDAESEAAVLRRAVEGALGLRAASAAARKGTLKFRLRAWLRDGWEAVSCELRSMPRRRLVPALLAYSKDPLLPSEAEAQQLKTKLEERCRVQVAELQSSSHEPLASGVDVVQLLMESPIYKAPKDPVKDYQFPSLSQVEQASADVERIASLVSPVFCSYRPAGSPAQRCFGLEGVPTPAEVGNRPVLLVGNHQLFAADLGPLVREFLVAKGALPRGLAFPGAMRRAFGGAGGNGGGNGGAGDGRGPPLFETFGAVPVSPRNIFKLLQQGEMVLLFPGGIREALHGPGENYQLFWPKTDFVRVAARFDALVVPFAGVGADDNVQVVGNSRELRQTAEQLLPFMAREPKKRNGGLMPVSEALEAGLSLPLMAPPLTPATQSSPGLGDRFYFSFGKPVDLKDVDPKDREACASAYEGIRTAVEQEIAWLQDARREDPYRDFARRQVYERLAALEAFQRTIPAGPLEGSVVSCGRRAPSFDMDRLSPPGGS